MARKPKQTKVDRAARDAAKTQQVVEKFIALLEAGTAVWRKPWSGSIYPRSLASGELYRGMNFMFLLAVMFDQDYTSPYFVTFQGAINRGGCVRKGERGWPILMIDHRPVKDEDGKPLVKNGREMWRTFHKWETVFNVGQCDGLPAPDAPAAPVGEPLERAQAILSGMLNPPLLEVGGNARAFYRPKDDLIHLPGRDTFLSIDHYYATLFRELAHSTGHSSRLNRDAISRLESTEEKAAFGDDQYGLEELIAELTAARLCGEAGIENADIEGNQAAYLAGWVKALKAEPKILLDAAAAAQKAFDHVVGAGDGE